MTNEELRAHISAIQSALNKGIVEVSGGPFPVRCVEIHCTDTHPQNFYIRPQPREVWVRIDTQTGQFTAVAKDAEVAASWDMLKDMGRTAKFREVLSDD